MNAVRLTAGAFNAANLNNNLLIQSMTGPVLTVRVLNGSALFAQGPIASATCAVVGKDTFAANSGHTNISYTAEHWFADVAQSEVFTGLQPTKIDIGLPKEPMFLLDKVFDGFTDPFCVKQGGVPARLIVTPDPVLTVPIAIGGWGVTYTATCIDEASLNDFIAQQKQQAAAQAADVAAHTSRVEAALADCEVARLRLTRSPRCILMPIGDDAQALERALDLFAQPEAWRRVQVRRVRLPHGLAFRFRRRMHSPADCWVRD
mgnify:CR=1 FL=1